MGRIKEALEQIFQKGENYFKKIIPYQPELSQMAKNGMGHNSLIK